MTISNFTVTPNVIVPGESVHVSFTLSVTSSDTVNGLTIYGGNGSWFSVYRDDSFTLTAGKSTVISFDKVIPKNNPYVSQNIGSARALTDPMWAVVLGSYGSRAEVQNPVTYLNMRYLPTISSFALERATSGVPDDEGVNVLTTLRLTVAGGASTSGMSLKLYYAQGTQPTTSSSAINLTGSISTLLSGVTGNASLITNTFSNGSDWHFLLVFGDGWEQTQVRISLPRAFANLHLSGCTTGGACFGGFSASTQNNPALESYYPALFHGGIEGVTNYQEGEVPTGGTWIDGKPIYRSVLHFTTTLSGAGGTVTNLPSPPQTLISARGFFHPNNSNALRPIPFCQFNDVQYAVNLNVSKDSTGVNMTFGTKWSGTKNVYLILEYTKE